MRGSLSAHPLAEEHVAGRLAALLGLSASQTGCILRHAKAPGLPIMQVTEPWLPGRTRTTHGLGPLVPTPAVANSICKDVSNWENLEYGVFFQNQNKAKL